MKNELRMFYSIDYVTKATSLGYNNFDYWLCYNIFEEMIVPPSPGDSGSAIGAANFAYLEKTKNKM